MFSYWFMTAFSTIGMDWQADSVTPWLANSGDGVWHTRDTNGFVVNCINLSFSLLYLPLHIQCQGPSAWNPTPASPLANHVILFLPQFPQLKMKDNGVHLLHKVSNWQTDSPLAPNYPVSWCPHVTPSGPASKDPEPAHSQGRCFEYIPSPLTPLPQPCKTPTMGLRQAVPRFLAHGNCEVWVSFQLLILGMICCEAGDN